MTDDKNGESQKNESEAFPGEFRPTPDRLKQIIEKGRQLLENADDDDLKRLGEFSE